MSAKPPVPVIASLVLFGGTWVATVSMGLVRGAYWNAALVGVVFWLVVLGLLLRRAWRGGPFALLVIHRIGIGFGALLLVAVAGVLLLYRSDPIGETLATGVPALAGAAALLASGLLLHHRSVEEWQQARNVRPLRRPASPRPDPGPGPESAPGSPVKD